MESIELTCPNCGEKLQTVPDRTAVRCQRCGVAILIEDVMNTAPRDPDPAEPAEDPSPRNQPGRPWSVIAAAACLIVAVIVLVCFALPQRAAAFESDPVPTPESEKAEWAPDDDIGDVIIGPDTQEDGSVPLEDEDTLGSKVVGRALTKLGCPYVYGGKGDEEFDCSGLVYWAVYQEDPELGKRLYTNAAGQAKFCYDRGLLVERSQLQPGDLVFWVYKKCSGCHRWKEIHHVGIYAGDGKVIEAAGDKGRVIIRKLWKTKDCPIIFYGRPYGAPLS